MVVMVMMMSGLVKMVIKCINDPAAGIYVVVVVIVT